MIGVHEVFMTRRLLVLVAGLIFTLTSRPVVAHHSETAEYDSTKPVKVTGTITKVEWLNPHVWFYVDVKDASGKVTTWGFSNAPPGALMRRGIMKDALKIGAEVTVEGVRARDGSNNASGRRVTYADGTNAFTATENAK
jgi:hypothetical protein